MKDTETLYFDFDKNQHLHFHKTNIVPHSHIRHQNQWF